MAYAAWSVVFGEQPSAAKWNILGTNDSSFNDGTGIANLEIGSGHTSMKLDYKFFVYRNAALNTVATTPTLLPYDTKVFDTSTNIDVVTNKGRFTAPVAGFYFFAAAYAALVTGNSNLDVIHLYKNGLAYLEGNRIVNNVNANTIAPMVGGVASLAANDYVEVFSENDGTYAVQVGAQNKTWYQGFLISQT